MGAKACFMLIRPRTPLGRPLPLVLWYPFHIYYCPTSQGCYQVLLSVL